MYILIIEMGKRRNFIKECETLEKSKELANGIKEVWGQDIKRITVYNQNKSNSFYTRWDNLL